MRKLRRIAFVVFLVACGSRTGLPIDEIESGEETDSGIADAKLDHDAGLKDGEVDLDALPPLDVQPNPDVVRNDCPDADATLIYVMTESNDLYSFYPSDGTFTRIGAIACPAMQSGATPFSMAVNRKGIAYVEFNDGELFRVSTATAACTSTSLMPDPNPGGFYTFGMSFTTDLLGPTETLYVAGEDFNQQGVGLGSIDTTTFTLKPIGQFNPIISLAELAGTGDGRLFTFYADNNMAMGAHIAEVQKGTANLVAQTDLPDVTLGQGWAFGFWGGDFYLFTAPNGAQTVQRYRPSDGTTTTVGTPPEIVVGAGVSTCAPQQ